MRVLFSQLHTTVYWALQHVITCSAQSAVHRELERKPSILYINYKITDRSFQYAASRLWTQRLVHKVKSKRKVRGFI